MLSQRDGAGTRCSSSACTRTLQASCGDTGSMMMAVKSKSESPALLAASLVTGSTCAFGLTYPGLMAPGPTLALLHPRRLQAKAEATYPAARPPSRAGGHDALNPVSSCRLWPFSSALTPCRHHQAPFMVNGASLGEQRGTASLAQSGADPESQLTVEPKGSLVQEDLKLSQRSLFLCCRQMV